METIVSGGCVLSLGLPGPIFELQGKLQDDRDKNRGDPTIDAFNSITQEFIVRYLLLP